MGEFVTACYNVRQLENHTYLISRKCRLWDVCLSVTKRFYQNTLCSNETLN